MLLSYKWLKELTGTALSPQDLADALTRAGLNVEEVNPVGDDFALNADITTNRPDWLCHLGVAHEIAAASGGTVKEAEVQLNETGPDVNTLSSVTVLPGAEEYCPRYTLRVLRGIKVAPSPAWLQDRLVAIGQRPINNIVDITNLVCFEMNQPLHAFDLDKLAERRIVLRPAVKGEVFAAITGERSPLEPDMLCIADAAKTVALAGVKGGANTEVDFNTRNILLESAWFQPKGVRQASRRTRMASESSYRFERGIDPGMTARASARAISLMQQLAGGELARGVVDTNPAFGSPWQVTMRYARCNQLLGMEVAPDEVLRAFTGLGLKPVRQDTAAITLEVPSFRQDLKREVDLIEEVIRLVGYDRIPEKITMPLALAHELPLTAAMRGIRRTLTGLGYHECITDAFVPEEWGKGFAAGAVPYTIQNPINAERPVLRTALAPSLLDVRRTNRLIPEGRFFELGRVYRQGDNGKPVEENRLAILDDRGEEYVRGAVEACVRGLNLSGAVEVRTDAAMPGLAPGTDGVVTLNGKNFAFFGIASREEATRFDLHQAPALAEVALEFLAGAPKAERRYRPLARFPGVRRDVSLSLPEEVRWSQVEEVAKKNADLLDGIAFESLYRGKGLKPGMKALAFSMQYRSPERSLTDAEANAIRDKVVAALLAAFPTAEVR